MKPHTLIIGLILLLLIILLFSSLKQFIRLSITLLSLKFVWVILIVVIALTWLGRRAR